MCDIFSAADIKELAERWGATRAVKESVQGIHLFHKVMGIQNMKWEPARGYRMVPTIDFRADFWGGCT